MNILKLQNNRKHKNKLKETPKVVLKCASPYNGLDVQLPPTSNPFASFQGGALLMLCICGLLTISSKTMIQQWILFESLNWAQTNIIQP